MSKKSLIILVLISIVVAVFLLNQLVIRKPEETSHEQLGQNGQVPEVPQEEMPKLNESTSEEIPHTTVEGIVILNYTKVPIGNDDGRIVYGFLGIATGNVTNTGDYIAHDVRVEVYANLLVSYTFFFGPGGVSSIVDIGDLMPGETKSFSTQLSGNFAPRNWEFINSTFIIMWDWLEVGEDSAKMKSEYPTFKGICIVYESNKLPEEK